LFSEETRVCRFVSKQNHLYDVAYFEWRASDIMVDAMT